MRNKNKENKVMGREGEKDRGKGLKVLELKKKMGKKKSVNNF